MSGSAGDGHRLQLQARDRYLADPSGSRVRRVVIPNGLPLDEIAKAPVDGKPLDPGVPVILNAGRFEPQKNLETLVRAMRLLGAERSVQTLCCGDGSLRKRIERLIADKGLGSVIRLEGFVAICGAR
jgi:glycosyltransferase involved in cell wall biosynthesis